MIWLTLALLLGLCVPGGTAEGGQHHRTLFQDDTEPSDVSETTGIAAEAKPLPPLTSADLVIVVATTMERLPLVHATRPARRGIRTIIAVSNTSEASRLNALHGGLGGPHTEAYVAWADADGSMHGGGLYGRNPPSSAVHPLHRLGPRWAMAPMLAHEVLRASDAAAAGAGAAAGGSGKAAAPYRWMMVGRDDTLWLPSHAVALLAPYGGRAAAVSDHLLDWNGLTLLAPSAAAAACLPCGFNLTAVMGRKRPPRVPQPACPVCRPASGCEFRFDLCGGLVGDGAGCGSRKFLGSGDRCAYSWAAGGAGLALSSKLVGFLHKEKWVTCSRDTQPSSGERTLSRCLWRNGFALTLPAGGLAAGLTRSAFSEAHLLFGNPAARQELFGAAADALLQPAYARVEEEAKRVAEAELAAVRAAEAAAAAAAGGAAGTTTAAATAGGAGAAAGAPQMGRLLPVGPVSYGAEDMMVVTPSTRVAGPLPPPPPPPPPPLVGEDGFPLVPSGGGAPPLKQCDAACTRAWVVANAVSVHLDVPYDEAAAVDLAAAAAVMEAAAKRVGAEAAAAAVQKRR